METDRSKKFSPSKLSTYQDCPRRYRYRYVDRIARKVQSVEAFLGTCVHAALEALYLGLQHGKTLGLEGALAVFEDEWAAGWSPEVRIRAADTTPEDWKRVGRECLELYYEQHAPFDQARTVEVEKRIGFPLRVDGEEVRIEGFIDRLALAPDGFFQIHDYKTGKSLPTQADVDEDWQLAIYDAAVRESWPDAPGVRLLWHYLRHGKTLVSTRTPERLAALKAEIAGLIGAIRRDHEFAPRKSSLCDWCEYKDLCPLWSHAEALAKLPPAERSKDEGARLVDALGKVAAEKRELKDALKEAERKEELLEAEILSWAEGRGLLAVSGEAGEAVIGVKDELKLPTKTHAPEAFEALEAELKAGPLWPEVSHLDAHRLLEGYKRKEWTGKKLALVEGVLQRYARRVLEKSVRFKRRKEPEED